MTDFDAFSPDPVGNDGDDPFGATVVPDGADPFAADGDDQDDPFAAGAEPEDMFNESQYAPAAEEEDKEGEEEHCETTEEPAEDAFGLAEEEPVTLESENKSEVDVQPTSAVLEEWQQARQVQLRGQRDEAREKKEELRDNSKQELAAFLAKRSTSITQTKQTNREEEKNQLAEMASLMEFGSQWEKVHKLVNLQPKPNEKKGSSRVDRMRALLIQMKHSGS